MRIAPKHIPLFLFSTCIGLLSQPALGLQIFLNDTGGAGAGTDARNGFELASQFWESNFADDIGINLNVGFSQLGSGILGQARSFSETVSYTALRDALFADASTEADELAIAHLPLSSGLNFLSNKPDGTLYLDNNANNNNVFFNVNRANLKALGMLGEDSLPDAEITFSSDFGFDFNSSNGIDPNLYDFVGIAIHEIGHAMGFVSGVDILDYYSGSGPGAGSITDFEGYAIFSVLDLYRFSDRSLALGESIRDLGILDAGQYFSINDGINIVAPYSTGTYNGNGNQASHWANISNIGAMEPTISMGSEITFSENDFLAFDSIGFDRIVITDELTPVSLPSSLLFMLIGLLSLNYGRKSKYLIKLSHQKTVS